MNPPAEFIPAAPSVRPGSWSAWKVALRPKTLWIATIPVLVGTALAFGIRQEIDFVVALIALLASLLMQVVTNLQNDVGYTERGGETGARVGLPRATANGWLPISGVKRMIVVVIAVAWIVSVPADRPRGSAGNSHGARIDVRRLGVHGRPAADRLHAAG